MLVAIHLSTTSSSLTNSITRLLERIASTSLITTPSVKVSSPTSHIRSLDPIAMATNKDPRQDISLRATTRSQHTTTKEATKISRISSSEMVTRMITRSHTTLSSNRNTRHPRSKQSRTQNLVLTILLQTSLQVVSHSIRGPKRVL